MNNTVAQQNELIAAIVYTFSAFIVLCLVLILFFYFSRKKILQKEIEKRELALAYQKELLHAVIITQEEERKRIAQDLHDDISSKLNIVSLNSHMLTADNLSEKEISEISINIINLTSKTLENSRRIAHDLLPPVLEKFGLDAGLKELCFEINSTKSVSVSYSNEIIFNDAEISKHLHIFRIIQELFNNSLKHGKATHISLQFKHIDGMDCCTYTDDGIGFNSSQLENQRGLGMKNIESRVSFLNGKLKVNSQVNKGIEVFFNF